MKLAEMQTCKSELQSAYDTILNALESAGVKCTDDGDSITIDLGNGLKAVVDVCLL